MRRRMVLAGVLAGAVSACGVPRGSGPPAGAVAPGAEDAVATAEDDARPLHERIDGEVLMSTVADLPEERSAVGLGAHREGLRSTQEMLHGRLVAMGYEVRTQRIDFSAADERQGPPDEWLNLWVEIAGVERPEEVLVIGAHFDAVPTSPGADDNATGVAALLELARVLAGSRPARTIRLVFFNLEEVGLIGSGQFAREVIRPRVDAGEERIVGMVSLEMLGYYSDEPGSQASPVRAVPGVFEPPTVGDFIALVGRREDQAITRPFAREMAALEIEPRVLVVDFLPVTPRDMARSDHASFWSIGVPAAMLTDTANFRNPHYHGPGDTIETLDAERFLGVTRQVARAVWALANEAAPPVDRDGP